MLRNTLLFANRARSNSRKAMEQHGIFADVIDKFAPTIKLDVKYGSKHVHEGNELKPSEVQHEPTVAYEADDKHLYTLAMVDPDAPSRTQPQFREWRHWLVSNIPGHKVSSGTVLSSYMGSAPPKGTGLHRYIFLLFQQQGKLDAAPLNDEGKNRAGFHIKTWAKDHHLTPVGCEFFQAQNESH
eukprot:TRINITY_DN4011_c0_g1_i1.p1 TRINITY_DN4011_c0_g1~~TRINITY_DN4011_c0_g1_i1.p1  ORF type:complete len:184 (-),score=31.52 TRINITY_DN4011_c0_g1_i1:94-645(-)